jgi:hypothetical protein
MTTSNTVKFQQKSQRQLARALINSRHVIIEHHAIRLFDRRKLMPSTETKKACKLQAFDESFLSLIGQAMTPTGLEPVLPP